MLRPCVPSAPPIPRSGSLARALSGGGASLRSFAAASLLPNADGGAGGSGGAFSALPPPSPRFQPPPSPLAHAPPAARKPPHDAQAPAAIPDHVALDVASLAAPLQPTSSRPTSPTAAQPTSAFATAAAAAALAAARITEHASSVHGEDAPPDAAAAERSLSGAITLTSPGAVARAAPRPSGGGGASPLQPSGASRALMRGLSRATSRRREAASGGGAPPVGRVGSQLPRLSSLSRQRSDMHVVRVGQLLSVLSLAKPGEVDPLLVEALSGGSGMGWRPGASPDEGLAAHGEEEGEESESDAVGRAAQGAGRAAQPQPPAAPFLRCVAFALAVR